MPYTSPRIFDLFVLVVDNYGDIGMVAEFILATELVYPRFFIFRVWTDSPQSVRSFFENNHLEHISIEKIDQFDSLHSGRYIGLFFHAPIPKLPSRKTLIFRFDHISFDLGWISGHGLPHITSNSLHQIEEFIPSFLPEGGGLIPQFWTKRSRQEILDFCHLSEKHLDTQWIPIFCYPETLARMDFSGIPDNVSLFILGNLLESQDNRILDIPFLPLDYFYSLYQEAFFGIVRGEVSFSQVFQMEIPFFWDMYKTIGGMPEEQSHDWITYIDQDQYSSLHRELNSPQKHHSIQIAKIHDFVSGNAYQCQKNRVPPKNMIHEIKKRVDRFEFSI